MEPLRLGVLGAARITELALVKPARATGTRLVNAKALVRETIRWRCALPGSPPVAPPGCAPSPPRRAP